MSDFLRGYQAAIRDARTALMLVRGFFPKRGNSATFRVLAQLDEALINLKIEQEIGHERTGIHKGPSSEEGV